jgi:hypothetical protein
MTSYLGGGCIAVSSEWIGSLQCPNELQTLEAGLFTYRGILNSWSAT